MWEHIYTLISAYTYETNQTSQMHTQRRKEESNLAIKATRHQISIQRIRFFVKHPTNKHNCQNQRINSQRIVGFSGRGALPKNKILSALHAIEQQVQEDQKKKISRFCSAQHVQSWTQSPTVIKTSQQKHTPQQRKARAVHSLPLGAFVGVCLSKLARLTSHIFG